MLIITLSIIFGFVSLLSSSVGFGGGSLYLAIISLLSIDAKEIPFIILLCNLGAVISSLPRFLKEKLIKVKIIIPFCFTSIPVAFIGSSINISRKVFFALAACSLFLSFFLMLKSLYKTKEVEIRKDEICKLPLFITGSIGTVIGFFSGCIGIGRWYFFKSYFIFIYTP